MCGRRGAGWAAAREVSRAGFINRFWVGAWLQRCRCRPQKWAKPQRQIRAEQESETRTREVTFRGYAPGGPRTDREVVFRLIVLSPIRTLRTLLPPLRPPYDQAAGAC